MPQSSIQGRRPKFPFKSPQGRKATIRRMKTGKTFCRPMNRVVHAHIKSLMPDSPDPDAPVFLGGGSRPNVRFRMLCDLAGVKPKTDIENGEQKPWVLKDLRKTCATYYDEHMPESSIRTDRL